MTKAATLHFAEKRYNIGCNSVTPGRVQTPLVDKTLAQTSEPHILIASWTG